MIDEKINDFNSDDRPMFSKSLSGVPKILDDDLKYYEFRKNLKINYFVLIQNLLLPWIMIFSSFFLLEVAQTNGVRLFMIFPFAFWVGFWLHSYCTHFHEAAHYNLHSNRLINDVISNILFTPFVGMFVKKYRVTHWIHHKELGKLADTEISYREPIIFKKFLLDFLGIYQFKIISRYFFNFSNSDKYIGKGSPRITAFHISMIIMIGVQMLIMIWLIFRSSHFAIIWAIAFFIFFPGLSRIRQILEHRSECAVNSEDYSKQEHGPVNRIFGKDIFSRYFGAAGFNSHLLHHLDPVVSYTRFKEMEDFLLQTNAESLISSNRTTYLYAFKGLVMSAKNE
jgi:fatty acid desaturase